MIDFIKQQWWMHKQIWKRYWWIFVIHIVVSVLLADYDFWENIWWALFGGASGIIFYELEKEYENKC